MSIEKLLKDLSVDLSVDVGQGKSTRRVSNLARGVPVDSQIRSRNLADVSGTDVEVGFLLTDQGFLIRDPDDKKDIGVGFQRLEERRWWVSTYRVSTVDHLAISFGNLPNDNVVQQYHSSSGVADVFMTDGDYGLTDADNNLDVGFYWQRSGQRRWWLATNGTGNTKLTLSYGASKHDNVVLDVDGQAIGLFGATPQARSTGWTLSNVTPDKTFDADSTTVEELADIVGTLIQFLIDRGDLGT